jgi:hypothetical protein
MFLFLYDGGMHGIVIATCLNELYKEKSHKRAFQIYKKNIYIEVHKVLFVGIFEEEGFSYLRVSRTGCFGLSLLCGNNLQERDFLFPYKAIFGVIGRRE